MTRGVRTARRGHARHDGVGLGKMLLRPRDERCTGPVDCRARQDRARLDPGDAGLVQRLARQIEPADRGVLVEVAQDVGELQRAPEMMGERKACLPLHRRRRGREPADRTGDAVAVEVERGEVRGAHGRRHVHLHAVDDGKEILAPEIEAADDLRQGAEMRRRPARVERVDVGTPALQPARRASRGPPSSAISSTARQKE